MAQFDQRHAETRLRRQATGSVRRSALVAAALLLAVLAALAASIFVPPRWWAPPDRRDPEAAALAEAVEARLAEAVSKVRDPDETWAIRVTAPQINAWLAVRLPAWLEHVGAPMDTVIQARLRRDGIDVAAGGGGRPATAVALTPALGPDGLSVRIDGVGVGVARLPLVSADAAREWLESMLPAESARSAGLSDPPQEGDDERPDVETLTRLLRGAPVVPVLRLGDGREVELLDLELGDGELRLRARTRHPSSAR